jgi:hypothetical protein
MARDDDPVRITSAAESRDADISVRQKRYLASMGLRTVCFVSAILVGDGWLRWVLVGAALILPYIAVVMANAVNSKSDDFLLPGALSERPQLPSGADPQADARRDTA